MKCIEEATAEMKALKMQKVDSKEQLKLA